MNSGNCQEQKLQQEKDMSGSSPETGVWGTEALQEYGLLLGLHILSFQSHFWLIIV